MDELTLRTTDGVRRAAESLLSSPLRGARSAPRTREREAPAETNRLTGAGASAVTLPRADQIELLEQITADLNSYFSGSRGIRFKVSPDTHEVVVQVVDRESDEVLRTIPPERLVNFRDSFREISQGILLDDVA